ncbi:MAG: GGDEF domain-containing protein, partial [Planctomycetota bacterium]|nr:GGDEF domain-containing protein [Planctomycetota bacterium]
MLDALKAESWHMVHKDDQLESAFSVLLVIRQGLLEKPVTHPTRLALIIPSSPEPPHELLDLLNGPLQTCGLLQWNGATLIERRPGELLQPPTKRAPLDDDVAGRIDGDVVELPPGPRPEEIDSLLGRSDPGKEHANIPPRKPHRRKPVALALTRDARRRAEAEGIAMARGTECFDAANTFDALWAIATAQTQYRQIALLMLGEELGEEGHRLSKAADMLEPGLDIHWLGKKPANSSHGSNRLPAIPPEIEIEIPTPIPEASNEVIPGEVPDGEEDHPDKKSTEDPANSETETITPSPTSVSQPSSQQDIGTSSSPPPLPPPPPTDSGSRGNEPPRDPTDLDLLRAAGEGPDVLLPVALQAIAAATGGIRPIFNRDSGEIRVGLPGGVELGWLSALPTTPSTPAEAWGEWLAHWLDHAQRFAEARRDAITDPLTLTLNRRGFEHHLRDVIQEGSRQRHPFSI